MGVWEVLPFKVALWLSNLSKIELWICLMSVFRMACVDAFSIGLNHISFPVQIIIEKNRLYLNKIVSRCNYSNVSVAICLAARWWEHGFLYTSTSKQWFQFTCYKLLSVRKPITLLCMLFLTKALYVISCFVVWLYFISDYVWKYVCM